jgi:hypothetical protein
MFTVSEEMLITDALIRLREKGVSLGKVVDDLRKVML